MLHTLGVDRIRLPSNNPDKAVQIDAFGVRVTKRIPTGVHLSAANARYRTAKVRPVPTTPSTCRWQADRPEDPMRSSTKTATTAAPLHPLLAQRWSPRAFDPDHQLTDEQVTALLEAARWAPSAANTQPWRFAIALRGSAEHATVLDALAPGNRAWAHAASALIVVAAETVGPDGTARPWAAYDTGQAVAHLSTQAQHEGLAVHQMGGFDTGRISVALATPQVVTPLVVVAVGRRDETVRLEEPFASRETAARDRLPVETLTLAVQPAPNATTS